MDIKELSLRYTTSEQAMRKYLRQHERELNAGGEHVKRIGRAWEVDAEGVRRLDKMRGYREPTVETLEPVRDEMAEIRAENRRLMGMLLASQNEVIRLQKELLRLKEPPSSVMELLRNWLRKSFDK